MKNKNLMIFGGIILVIVFLIGYFIKNSWGIGPLGSTHEHANFKVYINGELLDFSLPKYMVRVQYVHIENMNGLTIHKHAKGVTIGDFFESLGFKFNEECFIKDTDEEFCNMNDKNLKFYVNGNEKLKYENYEIADGDKYLISYGNSDEEIQKQLEELDKIKIEE